MATSTGKKKFKNLIYVLAGVVVLLIINPEWIPKAKSYVKRYTKSGVDGKYVNNEKGIITEIRFEGAHCSFNYFNTELSGTYEVDKGIVYIDAKVDQLRSLKLVIIDHETLKGEGWVSGTFIRSD